MTNASELQRLIESGRTAEAIELCEQYRHEVGIGSYYTFWLNRLQRPRGQTIPGMGIAAREELLPPSRNVAHADWDDLNSCFAANAYRVSVPHPADADPSAQRAALLAALPFKSEIYLPTAKIPQREQISGLQRVAALIQPDNLEASRLRFEALRAEVQRRGCSRVFVIGNGPSLKMTDLSLLRDEITIGFNGIFLHESFTPTIYVVEDHLVAEDRQSEIHAYRCPVKIFPSYLGYCIEPQHNTIFLNHRSRISYPVDTDFSADAGRITYTGGTVTYTGLQIAASLGVEEIVLIGVDASYRVANVERSDSYGTGVLTSTHDDTNHFDPRYFGKGYRWHDPNVHTMLQAYRKARDYARLKHLKIVNATVGGQLEVFKRVDFYGLFPREKVFPRVAIVDFTSIWRLSATGVIKRNLLEGWPKDALLHISADDVSRVAASQTIPNDLYAKDADARSIWPAFRALVEFEPQLLYLRPTIDRPALTVLQLVAAVLLDKPWIVHYMDDWLEKARVACDPDLARAYAALMAFLFSGASRVFAISAKMQKHLVDHHGLDAARVDVVHNFVPERLGERPVRHNRGPRRVVRYFGGMERDMCLATLLAFARQIDEINRTDASLQVDFEIYTGKQSIEKHKEAFGQLCGVSLQSNIEDYGRYLDRLADSDLNLICYNFDTTSLAYVRFSLANKLPELLAVGVPFLAIGHREIGTLELLADAGYPLLLIDREFSCAEILRKAFEPNDFDRDAYQKAVTLLMDEFSDCNNRGRMQRAFRLAVAEPAPASSFQGSALALLASFRAATAPALGTFGDIDALLGLVALPKIVTSGLLDRIRSHGLDWSISNEVSALAEKLPDAAALDAAGPEIQARALACLVEGLSEDRFSAFGDVVRAWLRLRLEGELAAVTTSGLR
jgi:glycosyltransferase involved in cell wall biosynthesis